MIEIRLPMVTEILERWHEIAPLLKRSTDRTEGCYEPEDIVGLIYGGRCTMLLVERDSELVVVAVVELRQCPRKRVLDISFVGGRPGETHMAEWVPPFIARLEDMAKECGAALLSGSGRIGWARVAKFKLIGGYMTRKVA